jgi:hypothetical protein
MKNLLKVLIISITSLLIIEQNVLAQKNNNEVIKNKFFSVGSMDKTDLIFLRMVIDEIVMGNDRLDSLLIEEDIQKKFPDDFKEIDKLKKKSLRLLNKSARKRDSDKRWMFIEESTLSLMYAILIYNKVGR